MRRPFSLQICLISFLFIFGAVNLVYRFSTACASTPSIIKNNEYDPELRTVFWIQSANTARSTGTWLALPDGKGGLTAMENLSYADDCGHAFFLSLLAQIRNKQVGREDLVRINFVIIAVGIIALSVIFLAARLPIAGGILLIYLANKAIPGPIPGWDVYSCYIGVACLALVPVIWVWSRLATHRPVKEEWGWGFFSYVCLGLAYLFRAPIGHIGLASLLIGGLVNWAIKNRAKGILKYVLVGALFLSAAYWRSGLVFVRPWTGTVSEGKHRVGHGIWQTFFHGLGTEPNPWGIQWDDKYGHDLIESIDPTIPYLSEPYMKTMRKLYFRCLIDRPATVVKIYWKKLTTTASLPIDFFGLSVVVVSGLWLIVLFAIAVCFPQDRQRILVSGGVMVFFIFFLAQGVLGIPWVKHLYPLKIILMIALLAGVESFKSRIISEREFRS